ncbi:daunorubicin/doxorubicin resistance ABC transporter ATP-binding protein DrrA [Streptomyces cinnamoneus]|uniref:Daunorubicin/doxorubicin resistance ABC transporter ATP-binding protein DrrA n=1 Tax=Streptomyces cinnamoneus TaxID=53446 RepID=A0A2G1XPS9_STRCJ|nr:ATP-binding cassette domain-containing protein [Streptomyces cinnamoneus]PHQ53223.1 daunorubicin/doxorubicin resistance ABC transporter ATP-binding protein DrrA [Streptomyces cinnamoneus]PPT12315.1 daunorubicin/doxorubicin resistance ABC transporter ATP-binding protein DrrA [Streptomyces cinnamoneus]
MNELMIETLDVGKTYGTVRALDGVNLTVPRGTVLGLLGHNGAGKTTLVNILATLQPPSTGTARVAGFDVVGAPVEVRRRIGLTGQYASVDEQMTGLDNLVLIARLLGAHPRAARTRAGELLERFELTAAAKRPVRGYSGGMRRRLDLAASVVNSPAVLFLDEPTTGLDPGSRITLWNIVGEMVAQGSTVVLTTQYLDEADRMADAITVLSEGAVVASGTPAELKDRVGRRAVTVTLASPEDLPRAARALEAAGLRPSYDETRGKLTTPVDSSRQVADVVRALDAVHVEAAELAMTEPTLDDVYLTLARKAPALAG